MNFLTSHRLRAGLASLLLLGALSATSSADLFVFGGVNPNLHDIPSDLGEPVALAAGPFQMVAVRQNGTVAAWGDDSFGQSSVPPGLSGVTDVAASYFSSLALKEDGTVTGWGSNFYGQISVSGISNVKQMAASFYSTALLHNNGTVEQIGNPYESVPDGLVAKAIAGGSYHTVALLPDGTVTAWGLRGYGQCDVPDGLTDVVAVAASDYNSMALKSDGTVVAWGNSDYGINDVPLGLHNVKAIALSAFNAYAILEDGSVTAWGTDNAYGQKDIPADKMFDKIAACNVYVALNQPRAAISLNTGSVIGGSTTTLTATITVNNPSLPKTVNLTSSDPAAVPVPATVTIPSSGNSVTITIPHNQVASTESVLITAETGGVVTTSVVTVEPLMVNGLTVDGKFAEAGTTSYGTLTLNAPVRASTRVYVWADDSTYVTLPTSVLVRPKNRTATFPITTLEVPSRTTVTVSAGWDYASKDVSFIVLPSPRVTSLKFSQSVIKGNQTAIGTVTLNAPAGDSGRVVALCSVGSGATVPASITIPAGATVGTFLIQSHDVPDVTFADISASTEYSYIKKPFTVKPMLVSSVTVGSSTIVAGETTTLTVNLADVVAVDTVVNLSPIQNGVVNVPTTATVLAGTSSVTVNITGASVTVTKSTGIRAERLGKRKAAQITVNPS